MYEQKKNGKVLTSKSVGTGPSSCEKRIYCATVSQSLRNTGLGVSEWICWARDRNSQPCDVNTVLNLHIANGAWYLLAS